MISSRISEGTFRPPGNLFLRLIWRSFRPSVAWCFGVAKGAFWRLAAPPLVAAAAAAAAAGPAGPAAELALFLPESRRDVKPRGTCFWRSFRPSVAWCFGVAKGAFWKLAAPPPAAPLAACSGSSSSSRPSRPSKPSS